ncbi:MAG: lycopene cyclase domain-containing protein, partial [Patescibacteria group bacterium]
MKFTYLKLLIAIYVPPIITLILCLGSNFDLQKLLIFSCVVVIYGIAWDMWATKHGRTDKLWIWRFNPKTITGIFIEHHPFDEYLFGF